MTDGLLPFHGVLDLAICDTPLAVIDVETTGLRPGKDRIVEIAIIRCNPDQQPFVALHTLLNPSRPVDATDIHGITDADLCEAPCFHQVAGNIAQALTGAVLAAYNAYFDVAFLRHEFQNIGTTLTVPFLCLMHLHEHLGLGPWRRLSEVCAAHSIALPMAHDACSDASASAALWQAYQPTIRARGFRTFRDLAERCRFSFASSLTSRPLPASAFRRFSSSPHRVVLAPDLRASRIANATERTAFRHQVRSLWAAHAEMDAVEASVNAPDHHGHPTWLQEVSKRLLSAQIGLTLAGDRAADDDRLRLLTLHRLIATMIDDI